MEEIEIGNQYKSRDSDSSGRVYEVVGFRKKGLGELINFKGVDINCKATWKRDVIEKWIQDGRLELIGKNLMAKIT